MFGPASLPAAFPLGNRKGMWKPGSLQPCQESPGGPAGVLGEAQGGPGLSPQALPDPAQHRGAAHGREWPWKHPQLLEVKHSQQGQPQGGCGGQQGEPLLLPGLLLAGVQPWHSPALQGLGALPALQLSPASAGSSHSSTAQTLRCVCVTPRAEPALQRGSKPYNTTARHLSQAWRGWGEQGVHVINIKSATKKRHILYIFDPYTQEHNIHRTPWRSGDVVRRFLRDVAPLPAPPLCLPHSWMGLYSQNISHQSSTRLAHGMAGVCGWSARGPRRACPAALGER